MLSQQHSGIPYVFTITGFEEPLCQFEIQNRLWFVFAICKPTGLSWSCERRLPRHTLPESATEAPLSTFTNAGRPTEACTASILIKSQQVLLFLEDASREEDVSNSSKSTHPALSLCGLQQKGCHDWQATRTHWYRGDHLSCLAQVIGVQGGGPCAGMGSASLA